MIFLISDTHFGHENIIKYCSRPFPSLDAMNEAIIHRWNSVVQPLDTVYHLGDFCLGNLQTWAEIRARLNGHVILIKGNHDRHTTKKLSGIFDEVHQFGVIDDVLLSHYPVYAPALSIDTIRDIKVPFILQKVEDTVLRKRAAAANALLEGACKYVIHGHVHNSFADNFPGHYNVSADVIDFTPQPIDGVMNALKRRRS